MKMIKCYGATLILIGALLCVGCSNLNEAAEKEKAYHELEAEIVQLKAEKLSLETTVKANNGELDSLRDSVSMSDDEIENSEVFWEGYEEKLAAASTLGAVFDLYTPRLDGAYSEGYYATLYDLFVQYGEKEFVEKLAIIENRENIDDIVSCLTSEMTQLYWYDEFPDLETHKKNLLALVSEKELSYREKQICYHLLADLEWIEQYGNDYK
ncbi:hypothetical protein [Fusibacter ferrireducens]|uniref:Lipoprotein n=1 Tax=Fusibacter ferrireducens TaxID=2785058 RepID=A0ABR9ZM89_9FIRM|nr:hypothetical protein [Fusibacter ferrireducens]MBF4691544.1 hypothetical protein [Fusibacter ferrireducens]